MKPSPFPADPAGTSEALAEAPPHLVARLAGRAPDAGQPSRAVLAAALLRIQNQNPFSPPAPPAPPARRFFIPAWSGWAAAAGLAVISAWGHADKFGDGSHNGSGVSGRSAAAIDNPSSGHGPGAPPPSGTGGGADSLIPGLAGADAEAGARKFRSASADSLRHRPVTLSAVQNMAQLRRDLAKLRAANEARFQASPGLSRTVVVEMTDPSDRRESARLGTLKLSDRVAESIAAGMTSDNQTAAAAGGGETAAGTGPAASAETSDGSLPSPQTPAKKPSEQDLVLSGGDGSWSGDVVIEKGLPNTGILNLPEGTQIRHLDFPVDDAAAYRGLQDLGSGWFYDQFSNLLWQPTGEGHVYTGQKAPAGFDAETFTPPPAATPQMAENPDGSATGAPAETGAGTAAAVPPAETSAPTGSGTSDGNGGATAQSVIAAATPPVRGYPIFDETTGSGSIILQNLPDLVLTGSMSTDHSLSFGSAGTGTGFSGSGSQVYQLWVTDPSADQPISVGLLPQLDGGNGRVWFDLGSPGVAPSGYILTVEPGPGSTIPTGKVILQGP